MSLDLRERHTSSLVDSPSAGMYAAIWTMGTLSGVLAAWAATVIDVVWLNLPVSVWAFLVVWASTTAWLSYRRVPSGVLARGLAFVAALVVLVPFVVFGPRLASALDAGRGLDVGAVSGGFYGLLAWGALAGVASIAAFALSRRLSNRAARLRRRSTMREVRRYE